MAAQWKEIETTVGLRVHCGKLVRDQELKAAWKLFYCCGLHRRYDMDALPHCLLLVPASKLI